MTKALVPLYTRLFRFEFCILFKRVTRQSPLEHIGLEVWQYAVHIHRCKSYSDGASEKKYLWWF